MKKYSLLFLMAIGVVVANAQETKTKAHVDNYRSWSIGATVGPTLSLGDAISFSGDQEDFVPSGVGGFEIGVRGHLTKWFNPTIGMMGTAGYHSTSGSIGKQGYYEGDYFDGDFNLVFNLSNWVLRGKVWDRRGALLLSAGIGISSVAATAYDSTGTPIAVAGATDFSGRVVETEDPRALQATFPVQLTYKYRLSNGLDLDVLYKHTFMTEDFPDAFVVGNTTDFFGFFGVGLSYNFGDKDKTSVVYANPLDNMFAEIEEVKNNFDQLTTDDDKDGVNNFFDKENNTPEGVVVDGSGKATDVDQDGIPDYMDEDPFTAKGAKVDANGRAVDSDGDGVPDYMDKEPNTEKGKLVNFQGKTIPAGGGGVGGAFLPPVYFAFNSASVTAANHDRLATVAIALKNNPNVKVRVVGHADKRGSEEYNKNLSKRRAEAVVKQLVQVYGIDEGRFSTESAGEDDPLANSRYDVNRRVDFVVQ